MSGGYRVFETSAGFCGIAWSAAGVARFRLPDADAGRVERSLRRASDAGVGEPPAGVLRTVAAARRYFDGEETDFSDVRLDLRGEDDFTARVYAVVRGVRWGRATTYGAVAKELGAGPEAARDVGQAMARNPVPLIIPCHRVLAAGGRVGGFSAPGGAAAKLRMLELEGIPVGPPGQLSFAF